MAWKPKHGWPRITRDSVIFAVGIGGIVHELYREGPDRPTLLLLFSAMVGLPAFLRIDEKRRNGNGNGSQQEEDQDS